MLLVDGGERLTYLASWIGSPGWPPAAGPARSGLGRRERGKHGDGTPRIGDYFVEWESAPDDRTLPGVLLIFSIFPDLNAFPDYRPSGRRGAMGRRHRRPGLRHRRTDGHHNLDGTVEVVLEGTWTKFGS